MSAADQVPFFRGLSVKRISMEADGPTLWVVDDAAGTTHGYARAEAQRMLARLPLGHLHYELSDALRLCDERFGPL